MPREVPTLNLEQVNSLADSQSPAHHYFHTYGILKQECQLRGGTYWRMYDEFKETSIKLSGPLTEYARPKPGDVIRIHRLTLNTNLKVAEIPHPRNVVVWPAFQHDPTPLTVARSPTIKEADHRRRRILETYFASKINRIAEIRASLNSMQFYDVAGRVDDANLDSFGHVELNFNDGTGTFCVRVFSKKNELEDNTHFNIAIKLNYGDYFVATNVKLDSSGKRLNLSANFLHGRSIRLVEKSSILGAVLSKSFGEGNDSNTGEKKTSHPSESAEKSSSQTNGSNDGITRRRSPRLLQMNSQEQIHSVSQNNQNSQSTQSTLDSNISQNSASRVVEQPFISPIRDHFVSVERMHVEMPTYTKFSDIQPKEFGYEFYDIVGQVRQDPQIIPQYGNCMLQIYDGSMHNHKSFHAFEANQVAPGCLILYVYSKQKDTDTDEHSNVAKLLKEGDLILAKNVKVSFKAGRIKLELNANKSHNKSINVIDKDSAFGRKLLDIVETPQVEELREMIDPSSSSQE